MKRDLDPGLIRPRRPIHTEYRYLQPRQGQAAGCSGGDLYPDGTSRPCPHWARHEILIVAAPVPPGIATRQKNWSNQRGFLIGLCTTCTRELGLSVTTDDRDERR